ncbi:helix-turn-helix transcriptional regulator [Sphingobium sp. 3R8]|uniref:helix-turn-helix domain-containing protein n=1 Tax=Sphingobium sp. 3R8 TaxID=2874921 RepID=UPI001CD01C53|nr:helix-turn-helix transcriptional regulator [Sphingobium sp. 3R8]MBZ9647073.1 helix-turn-helix transcriptional regulator [Sphingobium sp. 3R8]
MTNAQVGAGVSSDAVAMSRLTDRQRDCLRLLGQGYRIKEIAIRLGNSPETVKQHLAAARKILQVSTSVEAARSFIAFEQTTTGNISLGDCIVLEDCEQTEIEAPPPKWVNPSSALAEAAGSPSSIVPSRGWRRWLGPFGWLIPAYRGATNDLSAVQRVIVLVILPLAIMLVSVGALSSYETLLRLLIRLT